MHHGGCCSCKQLILGGLDRCYIESSFPPLELVDAQFACGIPGDYILPVFVGVVHRALDDTMALND